MNGPSITFISAGAGSGKTTRLTGILYENLLAKQARPEGILATTFTTRAAAEIKERVRALLIDKEEHSLAITAGESMIGTVNSVCGALLRRFAFELGLTVEQKVLDEQASKIEISRSIDHAVTVDELKRMTVLAERLGIIDRRSGDPRWKDHVKAIIDHARYNDIDPGMFAGFAARNADELLGLWPASETDDIDAALLETIDAVIPAVEEALRAKEQKNTKTWYEELRRFRSSLIGGEAAWSDWVKMARSSPQASLRDAVAPLGKQCARFVVHPRLHSDIRHYLDLVFDISARTLGIYQQEKHEMGLVDFADQESRLLEGLDNPRVQEMLQEKLDLLLVDEFQDTSPLQLALFLKLSQLAKRTYWVGDIKQAIYGFRGGDARLMQAVLQFLPAGQREVLDKSWRTVPPLVEAVNDVFTGAFSPGIPPEDVVLEAQREDEEGRVSCFRWDLGSGNAGSRFAALSRGIGRLVAEGYRVFDKRGMCWRAVRYGDIAVLARSNAHVREIAAALSRAHILVATVQPGLLSVPESLLVLAGLRRLHDSADTLASAEILSLVEGGEPEAWLQDRLDYLGQGGDPDFWRETGENPNPVLAAIGDLRSRSALFSPAEAMQAVITVIHAAEHAIAWSQGAEAARSRLLNLQAVLQLARDYEEECLAASGSMTIAGLLNWLNVLAAEALDAFPEPQIDAVRVMTHHKAKGLEWPVVVLLDLDEAGGTDLWSPCAASLGPVSASAPLQDRFIRFWPWPFGAQKKADGLENVERSDVAQQARAQARDESVRLLYVSMTRARDCLVFAVSGKSSGCAWLDAAGAGCMVELEDGAVRLPGGGKLPAVRWDGLAEAADGTGPSAEIPRLCWYAAPRQGVREDRHAEVLSPSEGEAVDCSIGETVHYGNSLELHERDRKDELGTAVHAVFAFALLQNDREVTAQRIRAVLDGYGMAECADPEALRRQVIAFKQWLFSRWPEARLQAEVPLLQRLAEGRVLKGQIDLLLDTGNGWVVIDHKTNLNPAEAWEGIAKTYSGQLRAYSGALQAVGGKPVESCWVHFAGGGGLVQLVFP